MERGMRTLLLLAALATGPAASYAQSTAFEAPAASFGMALAVESLPGGLNPTCGSIDAGGAGTALSAFLALPLWQSISIEGRLNGHLSFNDDCILAAILLDRDGLFTDVGSQLQSGSFAAIDARLRIATPRHWLIATLGAGWAGASKDIPYLVGSIGMRHGAEARFTAEIELRSYRVPWTAFTAEFEDGLIVREIARQHYETWEPSISVRFGFEVPVSGRSPN
jgi:hypothetical protein